MNARALLASLTAGLAIVAGAAPAESSDVREYRTANGQYRLEVPQQSPSSVRLFQRKNGKEKARWTARLEAAPRHALISEDGKWVALFEVPAPRDGSRPAVRLYGESGALAKSLALADILSAEEIAALPQTGGDVHWVSVMRGPTHRFEADGKSLVLGIAGGDLPGASDGEPTKTRRKVDLASGTVSR